MLEIESNKLDNKWLSQLETKGKFITLEQRNMNERSKEYYCYTLKMTNGVFKY